MKHQILTMILALLLLVISPDLSYSTDFGPYKGKIVDAETMEPIEGVVVLVEWWEIPFFGGSKYIDAQETVTDKNGDFRIDGIWVFNPIKRIGAHAMMTIFKSGYQHHHWSFSRWSENKPEIDKSILKIEDGITVIALKRLTIEERIKNSTPSEPSVIGEKYHIEKRKWKLLRLERNKDRKEIWLDELIDSDGFGRR